MKPLKLKCMLLSEDGATWIVIRQYYASDLVTEQFLDEKFTGMKLIRIDKGDENGQKPDPSVF
jgi:hypothetical protein